MKTKKDTIDERYFSCHKRYCSGYLDSPNGYYAVLPYIGIASIRKQGLPEQLERIMAFDAAEISHANIGKINAITVSSFIGPDGMLAGYDIFRTKDQAINRIGNIDICSLDPLLKVTSDILGTARNPVYPIFPGSMVPCALKDLYLDKEGTEIYSGLSISVPKNRRKNPLLLMEDVGIKKNKDFAEYASEAAKASIEVCKYQNIEINRIYVSQKSIRIEKGQLACALVMCTYVHLAGNLKDKLQGDSNGH